jgi:hypothetical protein
MPEMNISSPVGQLIDDKKKLCITSGRKSDTCSMQLSEVNFVDGSMWKFVACTSACPLTQNESRAPRTSELMSIRCLVFSHFFKNERCANRQCESR